jgi:hypothetical protein
MVVRRRREPTSQCYYCGAPADGSEEHVPPEVLYEKLEDKKADPADVEIAIDLPGSRAKCGEIIKVPSCLRHNEDASEDDAAFAKFVAREAPPGNMALVPLWNSCAHEPSWMHE